MAKEGKKKIQLSNFSSILNNHDTTHLEILQKPLRFGNTVEPSLAQATNNSSREVKCYIPSQALKKMMNWKIHGKRL